MSQLYDAEVTPALAARRERSVQERMYTADKVRGEKVVRATKRATLVRMVVATGHGNSTRPVNASHPGQQFPDRRSLQPGTRSSAAHQHVFADVELQRLGLYIYAGMARAAKLAPSIQLHAGRYARGRLAWFGIRPGRHDPELSVSVARRRRNQGGVRAANLRDRAHRQHQERKGSRRARISDQSSLEHRTPPVPGDPYQRGATFIPRAQNPNLERASSTGYNLGQSFIVLLNPRLNLMLEAYATRYQSVAGPGKTTWCSTRYLSPGVRWAFNFKNGLQIVPGVGVPVGVGSTSGEKGVFLYLSFEHPFSRR